MSDKPFWIVGQAPEYYVEICSDDRGFGIIVDRHYTFSAAAKRYDELVHGRPQMRVVMRHCAHIYRAYIPDRLKSPTDRRD